MKHNEKLSRLSKEQENPLLNIHNTVIFYGIEKTTPKYVLEIITDINVKTLSYIKSCEKQKEI